MGLPAADPYNLARFVSAQGNVYDDAIAEIRAGRKRSHWMWFVFPQLTGLGSSGLAQTYAVGSLNEAVAYLRHPILGPRYAECIGALLDLETTDPIEVFGAIDAMKLRSSLTLFALADGPASLGQAIGKFFDGEHDEATHKLLRT